MAKYLIFPTFSDAQARSAEQALALGCDPESTTYWWSQFQERQAPGTPRGALRIEDSGPYGPTTTVAGVTAGLTTEEQAALVTISPLDADWFDQEP